MLNVPLNLYFGLKLENAPSYFCDPVRSPVSPLLRGRRTSRGSQSPHLRAPPGCANGARPVARAPLLVTSPRATNAPVVPATLSWREQPPPHGHNARHRALHATLAASRTYKGEGRRAVQLSAACRWQASGCRQPLTAVPTRTRIQHRHPQAQSGVWRFA